MVTQVKNVQNDAPQDGFVLDKTKSICKSSFKIVDAEAIERDGKMYLRKKCPEHGIVECEHIFGAPALYKNMKRIFCDEATRRTYPHELVIYLTEKCNLKCPVCYIKGGEAPYNDVQLDDIMRLLDTYEGRCVHLSGGEPTVREDLFDIIKAIKEKGFFVGLFTNGITFADEEYVRELKEAGVDLVILSFESLQDDDYVLLKGKELVNAKLRAIENMRRVGLGVYCFCSIAEGVNDDQIVSLVEFAKKNSDVIEIMNLTPIWRVGRFNDLKRISSGKIYAHLEKAGLFFEDFMLCTEFSYLLFEVINKLLGSKWVRQPPCAQLVYLVKIDSVMEKINNIITIEQWISSLQYLNKKIKREAMVMKWIWCIFGFPWATIIKDIIRKRGMKKLLASIIRDVLNGTSLRNSIRSKKVTIMTGQVHGIDDADFQFINRCTLFAANEKCNRFLSFCTRQLQCELQHTSHV